MTKTVINLIILFIVLVLLQAVVFNNLILFNTAIALVFIYFIIVMPMSTGTNLALAAGFLLGLCVDIFSDTPGMNALACTILAFIRKPVYRLCAPHDEELMDIRPSIKSTGAGVFIKYAGIMTVIYCFLVFTIEAFSFFDIQRLLTRAFAASAYTLVIILAFDALLQSKAEKKA